MKYKTLGFERTVKKHIYISANAGELSRAPFFQTLYSSQRAINCLMITKFDFFEKYDLSKRKRYVQELPKTPITTQPHQKIYFGSPGTGKSYKINNEIAKGYEKFVVTFHPDFDYFDFVGSYKPETIEENGEKKIIYAFTAQRFMEAYIRAWETDEPIFLIIEEINRGRCASIFGDIFQLLDRDENSFSEYFVSVSKELNDYLKNVLGENETYIEQIEKLYFDKNERNLENPFSVLSLPNNLYIHATMNTSDQALFPMDSAFKRRWEWEYMPINYEQANNFVIDFGGLGQVSWQVFLENINQKIYDITQSEDKQIGTWFVKTNIIQDEKKVISKSQFLNKVMYYLWFDVFMYESKNQESYIFQSQSDEGIIPFTYSDLFGKTTNDILEGFLNFNNIPLID
ncbi:MAG: AAA family ATPase [Saprospiraceae bacterium]